MFLLVLARSGSPRQRAIKRLLLLLFAVENSVEKLCVSVDFLVGLIAVSECHRV